MPHRIKVIIVRILFPAEALHARGDRHPRRVIRPCKFSDPPSPSRDFWRELDTMPKHCILDFEAWALARGRRLNLDSLWLYQREQHERTWRIPAKVLSNGRSSSW